MISWRNEVSMTKDVSYEFVLGKIVVNVLLNLKTDIQKNLIFLFVAGLFFWISITLLLPTLPTYIQDVGGTTQQVGLVMGCFAIGLLVSRTWLGKIADQRGRKLVVLIGAFVAGTAPLGYIFIQSITGLALVRAFHGISIAAFTIGFSALVVDCAPKENRGQLIGYMNLAVPVGMSIGPALGGFLQVNANYSLLFGVSAFCGLTALILGYQLDEFKIATAVKPDAQKIKLSKLNQNRSFSELIRNPGLLTPSIILFLIGFVFGGLVAFLPLYIRSADFVLNAGLFYTVIAIASFTVRIFIGKISDNQGRGILISFSLIFYAISMFLLAIANSPAMLLLAAVAEGAGAGILIPTMLALISDRSYANERGRVYALCLGGFDVGIAIAGPILGFLTSYVSYRGVFTINAALAIIALVVFMLKGNKGLTSSWRFAIGKQKDLYNLDV